MCSPSTPSGCRRTTTGSRSPLNAHAVRSAVSSCWGDNLDLNAIEAVYSDGVLRLAVPVAERAKPPKINVSLDSGSEKDRAAIRA